MIDPIQRRNPIAEPFFSHRKLFHRSTKTQATQFGS